MGTIPLTATDVIEAGAVAHPSLLSVPDDIEKIKKKKILSSRIYREYKQKRY